MEIENQAQKLEVALQEKESLLKVKNVSLTELDKLFESASQTQADLLKLQCGQKKQSFSVQEQNNKLAHLQNQLSEKTTTYNDLCCEYKEKKRHVTDASAQNTKLQEAVECAKF